MQAIHTRFIGPTNTRGSRYKASCEAGTLTLGADAALGSEDNHRRAAAALISHLGWWHEDARGDRYGDWYGGGTKDGYVFVCTVDHMQLAAPAAPSDAAPARCEGCGATWEGDEDTVAPPYCDHCAEARARDAAAEQAHDLWNDAR